MTTAEHTPSWQSRVVNLLVRARMRPYAVKPLDPVFLRPMMGRPRSVRHLMLLASGARATHVDHDVSHPPGDWVAL